ncbi:DUF1569 domain-containing protein [Pontimicrobium aquaticum]|uniref:DUF1569 domain-containing protein n=1 Tax=Pontimicrobium aquaticum TaxID=2565367 RepID=A0A4U0F0X0_9FLAO|nr:DUF1569 domain-containing protein [Pontimicrobium aquaticum]TJY38013.1 DUF1569 domain-containing protein [Pontimicrobium aquaticum]
MLKRQPKTLIPLIQELERYVAVKDKRNAKVSTSDVAWQIDHSLKVINLVCDTLLKSNPEDYKRNFNTWRLLLFTIGYFPRGKVKAPKFVRPPEIISIEDLNVQIQTAYQNIEKLKSADKHAHFKHFVFGVLHKKRTIRFLQLHTNHHLKIIRDILNSN